MFLKNKYSALFILAGLSLAVFSGVSAQTDPDEIINKIEEREKQIQQLEAEIKQYNAEVDSAAKEANTLKSTIKTLDLTKKKISTDINLTENKISKTNLTITQLDSEIDTTEEHIELNKKAIINAIRSTDSLEKLGMIHMLLSSRSIGDIWVDIDNIQQIQETIKTKSNELAQLKTSMENKQTSLLGQKTNLVSLKQDLSGKKQAVELTAKEKAALLTVTKNKEEAYKEIVKTKEELKAQFEREIYEYESQLNYEVDKSRYPSPKKGILAWPLDTVFLTQKFGKTVGAEKLYASGSHNGVDFRASTGTRVKNVLSGTVAGTGNTDAYPGCYSFGKWVLVRHDNGLSTIYAHLSAISVSNGQRLNTGDTIGFSGNTGYSTGPHLHITVYATQGVKIEKYTASRGCKEATIPLADIKAYLDPLAYFPSI
jgi:murein DD-endopeptidase MepM/ murein hydrolase activator NlpD